MLNLAKDVKVKIIQIQLVSPFQIPHVYNNISSEILTGLYTYTCISYSVIIFLPVEIHQEHTHSGDTFYRAGALGWLRTQAVYPHYAQLLLHAELVHIHQ